MINQYPYSAFDCQPMATQDQNSHDNGQTNGLLPRCSDPSGWLSVALHYTGSHLTTASSMKVRGPFIRAIDVKGCVPVTFIL